MPSTEELNNEFGIDNQLCFEQVEGGLIMIDISNQYAKARISTSGGQILSYQPHSENNDMVFLSEKANYLPGKMIRGGVPVCWPWFGDDTSGYGRPSHGFARNQQWDVLGTRSNTDGSTTVTLCIKDTDGSQTIWPYKFKLLIEITVGKCLEVQLTTKNTGKKTFTISQALHTYFNVSDISKVVVNGLDGCEYLDKLDDFSSSTQAGDVVISQEIDRIYQNSPAQVTLKDSGFDRIISISAINSRTTVIWNPWTAAISKIDDLDDSSYPQFLCVETANAADDCITIPEGRERTIKVVYEIKH